MTMLRTGGNLPTAVSVSASGRYGFEIQTRVTTHARRYSSGHIEAEHQARSCRGVED